MRASMRRTTAVTRLSASAIWLFDRFTRSIRDRANTGYQIRIQIFDPGVIIAIFFSNELVNAFQFLFFLQREPTTA